MSALPAFDVFTRQKKIPAPRPPARGEERLDRVAPEVGVDGERVHGQLAVLAVLEVGVRVGARGRADVAALPVGDDEERRRARVVAHLLVGPEAVGAERLEERDLRLHSDDVRRDGVDQSTAEAGAGVRRRRRLR